MVAQIFEDIIPLELVEQIQKHNCVLFLGTGTMASQFDQELITEMTEVCKDVNENQSLSMIMEFYEMLMGRHNLVERVCNWIEKQGNKPSQLEHILTRLPINTIITTRLDLLIEESYRQSKKSVIPIVQDQEVGFGDPQKIMLVKMHGSIDKKDTLVLTKTNHLDFFKNRSLLFNLIKLLYATKTLLFIGYKLDDFQFELLQSEIFKDIGCLVRRAYAIWEKADNNLVHYWNKKNIKLIDCDPMNFLRALEQKLSTSLSEQTPSKKQEKIPSYVHPYKFLDFFEVNDAGLFFGRENEIEKLITNILTHRLMVLYGSSGSGKTSIIKAGIISKIVEFDVFPIYSRCLDSPLSALKKFIDDALIGENRYLIYSNEANENQLLNFLIKCQQAVGKRIFLIIDQFEELFRLPYKIQKDFIDQLSICVNNDLLLDLRLALVIRDDFFTELDGFSQKLPQIYHSVFRLQNLSEIEAVKAIVHPLKHFYVKYEDRLVELLIKDLNSEGRIAPAQVQIVCSRLYEQFSKERIITVENYYHLGGTKKILADYLKEVLERFAISVRLIAKQILQSLVGSRKTKKLLSGNEIIQYIHKEWDEIEPIVFKLESFRLLRKVETEKEFKYELVHEYIVQQVWEWLTEQETRIKEVQELIENESRYWVKYGTPISKQKLEDIYKYWNYLVLGESELELVFRSSVAFGYLKQWDEVSQSFKSKLINIYKRLLKDRGLQISCIASISLSKFGFRNELEKELLLVNSYTQSHIRNALRQLDEGRSREDFVSEVSDSEWKEKSLWNLSPIVGIDFGTTVSAIAVFRNQKPVIIPNREGSKFTPSVVAFTTNGEVVVGTPAVLQAPTNPKRTVFSIKRHLGTNWKIAIDGNTYNAVDISALIFKSLKQDAETYIKREVIDAVIAAPAYFNNIQLAELKSAAKKAGFRVKRIVAEPTAASLVYGLHSRYDRFAAFYDLGGGTFDVSILQIGEYLNEVKSVNGNTLLGGDDFDERIVKYLVEEFKRQHNINLLTDDSAKVRLKEASERAKITLSGLEKVNIYIPYIYADENGIKNLDIELTRSKFEELTSDLVYKTIDCCERAIKDAGISVSDINELIMVGLSTKIPLIRSLVSKYFGKEPMPGVDPDESVALGAAIQGGVLGGFIKDILLLDAFPLKLGIKIHGDEFNTLIDRNTIIPTKKTGIFTTVDDNQPAIKFELWTGWDWNEPEKRKIGILVFTGIPPSPKEVPQIEVCIQIEANSLITFSARDIATGKRKDKTIEFDKKKGYISTLEDEEKNWGNIPLPNPLKEPDEEKGKRVSLKSPFTL